MSHELVVLGAALVLAALLARLGGRIGLPTIPLFMAAGIIVGPSTPGIKLFDDPEDLALLATFGLVFLMFYLGVEFSLDDLTSGGRKLLYSAALYLGLNLGGGLAFGFALGWGTPEALVVAGAVGISSSAIVTKVLIELHRLANPETRLILGIIVIEDLFLALYLAALAPVLDEAGSLADAFAVFAKALAFLIGMTLLARFGARWTAKLLPRRDDELLVVTFVGVALLSAGVAHALGVSDAIGAFMAGLVLATTPARKRIERLVLPLRDVFAAVFFFAFGLSIDPADAGGVIVPVLIAVALSLVAALTAGIGAARINGFDRVGAANIGFTVRARGEFALILAALATDAGLDERVAPFVALYVLILAVVSPVLAAQAPKLARYLPLRLVPAPDKKVAPADAEP